MAKVVIALSILSLLVVSSATDAAPSCKTVSSNFNPCISYLEGRIMGSPPSACCSGVKSIASEITGKQDLVAICKCVKADLGKMKHDIIPGRVTDLARKCGIPVDLPPIDKKYDCSKIGSDIGSGM